MKEQNRGTHWVGMDVSKQRFEAALAVDGQRFPSTQLRDLPWKSFARSEQGVMDFLAWLDELLVLSPCREAHVVMEATGDYSVELAIWLLKQRPMLSPAIENPSRTKAFIDSLNQRNKTDGLDARALAFYGMERCPVAYEPLTPQREELRTLSRYRDSLVRHRAALKNQRHERCASRVVRAMRTRRLKQLDRDIEKLEQEIQRVIRETTELRDDYQLLLSIPGVGPVTAAVVLAEIGDLRRFRRARQLSAYVGVSPRIYQSGSSVRGKTHMCKRGNARVRQALFLSAMGAIGTKKENDLKATHRNLCGQGKSGKSSLGAVMRKQLMLMRAIIVSGKPYDPLWKTHGKMTLAQVV